jgi:hypothetical protein
MHDYGARLYDQTLGRWNGVDKLAEKYYDVSPYAYCANKPINYIDIKGCDSYYTNTGFFLFSDNSDSDNIMIRRPFAGYPSFVNGKWETSYHDIPISKVKLSAESYSRIFTNILDRQMGVDLNTLDGGKISVAIVENLEGTNQYTDNFDVSRKVNVSANAAMHKSNDLKINVRAYVRIGENDNRFMFSTESNVLNLLGVHEYKLHGINEMDDHLQIYPLQMNDPTWIKTSKSFKNEERNNYEGYKSWTTH